MEFLIRHTHAGSSQLCFGRRRRRQQQKGKKAIIILNTNRRASFILGCGRRPASTWAAAGDHLCLGLRQEEENQLHLGLRQEEEDQLHFGQRQETSFTLGNGRRPASPWAAAGGGPASPWAAAGDQLHLGLRQEEQQELHLGQQQQKLLYSEQFNYFCANKCNSPM